MVKPQPLPAGQCIELNRVTVSQSCPVGFTTPRSISFTVTAHTGRPTLQWRRSSLSSDLLDPSSGTLAGDGQTEVLLTAIVLGHDVTIEVVDGAAVLLRFTLRHF